MTTLTLARFDRTGLATYGHLLDAEQKQLGCTLELSWRDNQHDISCIPPGTYTAHRFFGKRPYPVFKLMDVPSRKDIEIHIGNTIADTHGCIVLGSAFGTVNAQRGVSGSLAAFRAFMEAMRGIDLFTLIVTDPS